MSHSTRVRGLKSAYKNCCKRGKPVALYTSAWIEILTSDYKTRRQKVALYTSAWIEIFPRH